MTYHRESYEDGYGEAGVGNVSGDEVYRAILENMSEAVMVCDMSGHIVYMNPAAEKLLDTGLEEAKGRLCDELLPCEEPDLGVHEGGCPVEGLLSGEMGLFRRECKLFRQDGSVLDLQISHVPLRTGGEVSGIVSVIEDITHMKLVERTYINTIEALGRSERRYRLLFDSAPDGVCIMDTDGNIVECNLSESRIYGRPAFELAGRNIFDLVEEDSVATLRKSLEKVRRLESAEGEFKVLRPDGGRAVVWHKWIPLRSRGGELEGVLSYDRDVTELKKMEMYMLRTERLAAMGRLAAALAHEINNPLQAIASSLELVLDFPLDEGEKLEYLKAIRSEIERLIKITSRVLEFARPPQFELKPTDVVETVHYALSLAGRKYHVVADDSTMQVEPTDVAETVYYVLALAGKQLEHSRIHVITNLPDSLPAVLASRDHLAQVFLNLIINAMEAMPDGGELRIRATRTDGQVEITFADTGPGIPPDALDAVFEPFYTTKEGGTGLGLSISHKIIQMHGGTISASNSPDGGAVITVRIPVAGGTERDEEA